MLNIFKKLNTIYITLFGKGEEILDDDKNISEKETGKFYKLTRGDQVFKLGETKKYEIENELNNKNLIVYGWIIERNFPQYNKDLWEQDYGYKIYRNYDAVIHALNQKQRGQPKYGHRLKPLYTVTKSIYRDLLISDILDIDSTHTSLPETDIDYMNKESILSTYKLTERLDNDLVKGRIIIELNKPSKTKICLATPNLREMELRYASLQDIEKKKIWVKTDIMNEKWVHPHLNKKLKKSFGITG